MRRAISLIEYISKLTGLLAAWLVVPLTLITCFEVFSRYALGAPTIWAYDIGYMLTGAYFLLGLAYTLRERGHIRIDVLYSRFKPRTQALIDLFGYIIIALPVTFWLTCALFEYATFAYDTAERTGQSAWNPYVWPFRVVFVLGLLFLTLQIIAEILKCLVILKAGSEQREAG